MSSTRATGLAFILVHDSIKLARMVLRTLNAG